MLLTVIIVTKDPGVDIFPTLASLKPLDGSDTEILIKDNSKDQSLEMINQSFGFENLRYIHSPDNGIYDAMNQALAEAKGEYIYFLNAGDQYVDCKLVKYLSEYRDETDYLYGDVIKLDPAANIQRYSRSMNKYLVYLKRICHQAIVMKKSVLDKIGGFDTNLSVTADYLLILHAVKNSTGLKIPGVLSIYQGGGFSKRRSENRAGLEYFQNQVSSLYSKPEIVLLNFLKSLVDWYAAIKRNRLRSKNIP